MSLSFFFSSSLIKLVPTDRSSGAKIVFKYGKVSVTSSFKGRRRILMSIASLLLFKTPMRLLRSRAALPVFGHSMLSVSTSACVEHECTDMMHDDAYWRKE